MHTWTCWTCIYREERYVADVSLQNFPIPARTLGRKLCGHDSTVPPLDFRSCSDAQFDKRRERLSQLGDQHGSLGMRCATPRVRLDERARQNYAIFTA